MANGKDFPAGNYVLTVDKFEQPIYEGEGMVRSIVDVEQYEKGDEIELNDRDARRLGSDGTVAHPDSSAAKAAQGVISEEAVRATSQLSLEEKKAQVEALHRQIEDEEAEIERLEGEDIELTPIPVTGHPGTAVASGDPDNQEDFTKSQSARKRGNRARTEEAKNDKSSEAKAGK